MTELAYDEKTDAFVTTNTTKFSTTAGIITGLERTVTGTGAAVLVEFYCPAVAVTASVQVTSWFVVTLTASGSKTAEQYRNWPASSGGTGGSMRLRKVLTNGVEYKFQVGLSASAAATITAKAAESGVDFFAAMFLRVTD